MQTAAAVDKTKQTMILVPAFNEGDRIAEVILSARQSYPDYDVIVVNDGSQDDTAQKAGEAGATVINHLDNMGYGVAIQTGYKYAQRKGYDFLVQIDGDGQHDPAGIADLLRPVIAGETDFALGSRFLSRQSYEPSLARKSGMKLFRHIVSFFTTSAFPCDYPDADMLLALHRAGYSIQEVPVRMFASSSGKSMHGGWKPLYYLFKMLLSVFVTLLRKRESGREER
ncbi:MAG: glycosyltransferase family 2 protein [Desulfuromonadales bacterium]